MAVGAADRVIANRCALKTGLGPRELGDGLARPGQATWARGHGQGDSVSALAGWPGASRTQASVLGQAGAVARLTHPGVVTVFDVVADDHGIFIVTELVQAPTLVDLVRAEGRCRRCEWPRSALR
jgi:hypothetical protein